MDIDNTDILNNENNTQPEAVPEVKRQRGRPRKEKTEEPKKNPNGRPRKYMFADVTYIPKIPGLTGPELEEYKRIKGSFYQMQRYKYNRERVLGYLKDRRDAEKSKKQWEAFQELENK